MRAVNSAAELRNTVLRQDWQVMPISFDVPGNSQILGQIAHAAGIEGILYPSTKNGKKCLAIYPENLKDDSFVELVGRMPKTTIHPSVPGKVRQNSGRMKFMRAVRKVLYVSNNQASREWI